MSVATHVPADGTIGAGLVTADGVELDIRPARLGSRAAARGIDLAIQAAVLLVTLGFILASANVSGATDATEQAIIIALVVTIMIGYPVAMETWSGGRTVGKIALGLRVVRDDGGPIRFRHALARGLVGFSAEIPGLVPPLTWFVSAGTLLAHADGKRLGDIAAGTVVIHDRSPATWGWVPSMPPELAAWAASLDLARLTDDLALAVRNFLARNWTIREPARTRLGLALTAEVAACTSPPPPPGTAGWAYLAAVIAERRARATRQLARGRRTAARVWPEMSAVGAQARWLPAPAAPAATAPAQVRPPVPADVPPGAGAF